MVRSAKWLWWVVTIAVVVSGCAGEGEPIQAPEVTLDVRSEESYRVGEDVIRIEVTAQDPQGLDLEFSVVDPPERATFQAFSNSAVFQWDPITSDVTVDGPRQLVFVVTNERGVSTERSVLVTIQAGNTEPRFLNSNSELYNPRSNAPMEFEVRVRDDDSPQVLLGMPSARAPEGATFEQTGDFTGRFEWMPSPVQMEQRTHSVTFTADDDDNPPVEHQVTIVIQQPSQGPGPGPGPGPGEPLPEGICTDDVIDHVAPGAQSTTGNFRIEGRINAGGTWDEAAVYYTTEDPMSSSAQWSAANLQVVGDEFSGEIPNPLLSGSASAVFSYTICAFSLGTDTIACGPDDYVYQFIAYSPDSDKCQDDGVDLSSAGSASAVSFDGWEWFRTCEGAPKYHRMDLGAGEFVQIDVLYPAGTEPDLELTVDGAEYPMEFYPCLGWAAQILEGPGEVLLRVEEESFAYHVGAYGESPECPGSEYEPNNSPGQATLIASDFASFGDMAICTEDDIDVFAIELVRGDEFAALMSFTHADGDLDMTLFAPSQVSEVVEGGFGVAQGWSTSDDESIFYDAEESGFHYLSVVTTSTPNTYELLVERTCVVDDAFAGNHSQGSAAAIDFTDYRGLKLCENQSDFYSLSHTGSSQGIWLGEVWPVFGSVSSLEVRVYNSAGQEVATGTPTDNSVDFTVEPEPGETYTVEVRSNRATIYDLTILDFS